jgi:hypothetical protein
MFGQTAGWPLPFRLASAVIVNLPGAALAWQLWRERPAPADIRWLILLLILWVGLQAAAMSWARVMGSPAPRYLDILALGPLANLAALLHLAPAPYGPWDLRRQQAWSLAHAEVVSAFLRSGDPAVFEGKRGPQDLPYPTAGPLQGVLTDPVLRRLLPPMAPGLPAPERVSRWLTDPGWGAAAQAARRAALASPPLLLGLALGLLAWWARANSPRRRLTTDPAARKW